MCFQHVPVTTYIFGNSITFTSVRTFRPAVLKFKRKIYIDSLQCISFDFLPRSTGTAPATCTKPGIRSWKHRKLWRTAPVTCTTSWTSRGRCCKSRGTSCTGRSCTRSRIARFTASSKNIVLATPALCRIVYSCVTRLLVTLIWTIFMSCMNPRNAVDEFLELFDDLDEILGTNEAFLLGRWLNSARNASDNDEVSERDAFQKASLPNCGLNLKL